MHNIIVPAEWTRLIKEIQVYFPQAVIAGGALRDLYHGRQPKDIDVFIPVPEAEDNLWLDQIENLDPYFSTIRTNVYGQSGATSLPGFRTLHAIYRIFKGWLTSGMECEGTPFEYAKLIPVELIFIQGEDKRISDSFDINICQIEYNGEEVYYTPAFKYGVEHGVIAPVNINRADRQEGRLQRMKDKYPEYTIHTVGDVDDLTFGD